jgi:hypothetical protein
MGDFIGLGAHLGHAQDRSVGLVKGREQVMTVLIAMAGAVPGLAIHRDHPPRPRPRLVRRAAHSPVRSSKASASSRCSTRMVDSHGTVPGTPRPVRVC